MNRMQLRDAKATLSAIVDQALQGEPSAITRNGRPEAVVLSSEEWQRLPRVPSFGRLLMRPARTPRTFRGARVAAARPASRALYSVDTNILSAPAPTKAVSHECLPADLGAG